jgi:hypothetical protein
MRWRFEIVLGVLLGFVGLVAKSNGAAPAEAKSSVADESPLLHQVLTEPDFWNRLDTDLKVDEELRTKLADAAYRKVGSGRSVRVELWRGTGTEMPAIVLDFQSEFKHFRDLPSGGAPQTSPVMRGTGRDSMWHRTFYGGTDDPKAHAEFEESLVKRAAAPSNKRVEFDVKFVELAEKYLPSRPLPEIRADLETLIKNLVAEHAADGATLLPSNPYGEFGAKITDHLYLYLREFTADSPTRFAHDPFLWLIVSGGPKPWKNDYLPSFPGAEGMGSKATGGRGGKVIYVENLNSTGPGSLAEALNTKGPRTVLFRVSGAIDLPDETWIREPNLTVIGYTAPGEGVEVSGRLCMAADNVIMRGMRFRLRPPYTKDGMNTEGNLRNIIFDHCSFAYSSDELIRFIGNGSTFLGFTIQYCLLGPGLAGLGDHPYGPEVGGYGSFHHNLMYNTLSRSPEVDCELVDWSCNIMSNLRSGHSQRPHSRFKFTNNYIVVIPGNTNVYSFNANDAVWMEGNICENGDQRSPFTAKYVSTYLREGYAVAPITRDSAESLQVKLLPIVGAFLPSRDATDKLFLEKFVARTSLLPYYEAEGKKWRPYGPENKNMHLYEKWNPAECPPPASGAKALADSDGDGMPDAWETAHGFNPQDPSDGSADADGDGYTNLEEYLNRTDPRVNVDYRDPKNNVHTLHPARP